MRTPQHGCTRDCDHAWPPCEPTPRIAGSHWCAWGIGRDPGNRVCENVALPGHDLCPAHERLSDYLDRIASRCDRSTSCDGAVIVCTLPDGHPGPHGKGLLTWH
jgi:hypothetical protein